jgi:urea-proton symporter
VTDNVNAGDKSEYLLARRSLGILPISMSIAAAWMWAPALMVAATLGYVYGFWGVFWFSVPNILAVLLFGPVADRARKRLPSGATYSGFQRQAHSRRVMGLFIAQDAMALFTNMLANAIAGGFVVSYVFDVPLAWGVLLVLAVPLAYTLPGGFRISTITDLFTMTAILGVVAVVAAMTIGTAGAATLMDGWVGTNGFDAAFIAAGLGLTLTVHLLAAPYSDQTLWQRAWAARPEDVRKAFLLGGALFAPVPILCGAVGMVAHGSGLELENAQAALFAGADAWLGQAAVYALALAVILAVVDTIDSCMSAVSAFVSDDNTLGWSVTRGRWLMVAMTAVTGVVALVPGLSIFGVQLAYSAVSGSTLLPGLMSLFRSRMPAEPAVFWAMLLGAAIGAPVFLYGMNQNDDIITSWGILLCVALSGVLTYLFDRYLVGRGYVATSTDRVLAV